MMDKQHKKILEGESSKLKDLTRGLEKGMNEALGNLKDIAIENLKISKPIDSKKITIDGKECTIALIEGGRIMIYFPDTNSQGKFYEDVPKYTEDDLSSIEEIAVWQSEQKTNDIWRNKSLWNRIFI